MKKIIIFSLCYLFTCQLIAQVNNKFGAAAVMGINAAQLDGDESVGFNQLGLTAGIQAFRKFDDIITGHFELLYSQTGSQNELTGQFSNLFQIRLNHLEIPIYVSISDWEINDGKENYHKVRAYAGLTYRRLISANLDGATGSLDTEKFENSDWGWILGVGYHATRQLAFEFRYTGNAFNRAYDQIIESTGARQTLISRYISLRAVYNL